MEGKAQAVDETEEALHIYVTYLTRERLVMTFRGYAKDQLVEETDSEHLQWALSEPCQSLLFALWLKRREAKGSLLVAKLCYLADKGGLQGCPACTTLQYRYSQGKSPEAKDVAFDQMRKHNTYWQAEREFQDCFANFVIASHKQLAPEDRTEGGQYDGYDVRKATLPIWSAAPNSAFASIEKKWGGVL
jgi:hypothetical protein